MGGRILKVQIIIIKSCTPRGRESQTVRGPFCDWSPETTTVLAFMFLVLGSLFLIAQHRIPALESKFHHLRITFSRSSPQHRTSTSNHLHRHHPHSTHQLISHTQPASPPHPPPVSAACSNWPFAQYAVSHTQGSQRSAYSDGLGTVKAAAGPGTAKLVRCYYARCKVVAGTYYVDSACGPHFPFSRFVGACLAPPLQQ